MLLEAITPSLKWTLKSTQDTEQVGTNDQGITIISCANPYPPIKASDSWHVKGKQHSKLYTSTSTSTSTKAVAVKGHCGDRVLVFLKKKYEGIQILCLVP
jgi:hypothetical protein